MIDWHIIFFTNPSRNEFENLQRFKLFNFRMNFKDILNYLSIGKGMDYINLPMLFILIYLIDLLDQNLFINKNIN